MVILLEVASVAELLHQVVVVLRFEHVKEAYNIRILEFTHDSDLS
jgi:hypothetical protein